ncbi:hypothetical protein BH11MYX3_BH11MYX3_03590 [soil metagenome]
MRFRDRSGVTALAFAGALLGGIAHAQPTMDVGACVEPVVDDPAGEPMR